MTRMTVECKYFSLDTLCDLKHCSTNSKHQHLGAKRCVLWPSKYAKMHFWPDRASRRSLRPLVGWTGNTPPRNPPYLLAPRFFCLRRSLLGASALGDIPPIVSSRIAPDHKSIFRSHWIRFAGPVIDDVEPSWSFQGEALDHEMNALIEPPPISCKIWHKGALWTAPMKTMLKLQSRSYCLLSVCCWWLFMQAKIKLDNVTLSWSQSNRPCSSFVDRFVFESDVSDLDV